MATWDEIKSTIKRVTDTAVKKTGEITESASIKIKISSKDSERERLFTSLGKLFYRKMKTANDESSEKLTRKIHEAMDNIDKLSAEIRALKKQLEEVKERGEEKEEPIVPHANGSDEPEDKLVIDETVD